MDLPSRNEAGYKAANVSNKIANFEKHEFYLLHGNADDNVHYQQAMRLARALEENNIFFLAQSYPDENHSIRSVVQHVYMSMTVFFDECLAPFNSAPTKVLLPALLLFPLLARLLA
ncbi:venom dipeptidyl peptidase 4-like, partial [Gryllus bimaculatus]